MPELYAESRTIVLVLVGLLRYAIWDLRPGARDRQVEEARQHFSSNVSFLLVCRFSTSALTQDGMKTRSANHSQNKLRHLRCALAYEDAWNHGAR